MYEITMDIETNGLDIYHNDPLQLAYQVHKDNQLFEEGSYYIQNDKPVSAFITGFNGITDKILKDKGVHPIKAVRDWQALCRRNQPTTLIGFNITSFDYPMWQNFINRNSLIKYKYPPICEIKDVMLLLADVTKGKWPKLIEAAKFMGIEVNKDDFHEALFDVKVTRMIYEKMKEGGYIK